MHFFLRAIRTIWTVPALLAIAVVASFAAPPATDAPSKYPAEAAASPLKWTMVTVKMPAHEEAFPQGNGVLPAEQVQGLEQT